MIKKGVYDKNLCLNIKVGDEILTHNNNVFLVTAEPYIPDDLDDSAIDEEYIEGEYIIPVDSGGAIYGNEVFRVYHN